MAVQTFGQDHGFRFIQVPLGVMMPEAIVEKWQHYRTPFINAAGQTEIMERMKVLVAVCNLL